MKLKKKISIFIICITIIPLILMTSFAYTQYKKIINRHLTSIANEQYDALSQRVRSSYNLIMQTLNILTFYSDDSNSVLSTFRSLDREDAKITDSALYRASQNIAATCQAVMYNNSAIKGIYIISNGRHILGHSRTNGTGLSSSYDPAADGWYKQTIDLNGSLYMSPVDTYAMFRSDSESFFISQFIRDVDRSFKPLGVILIEYSPELFDLSQENALNDLGLITLTNTANQTVVYTNEADFSSDLTVSDETSRVEPVFRTPFQLSMTLDYASLAKEYRSTLVLLLILAVFSILCILIMVIRLTHSFIHPIQQLSEQMLQNKNLPADSPHIYENRKDEIGILYRQYNQMMNEISASIKTEYQNKLIILDAQMQSLEARINSHFLFNTLESINSMAELADQEEISTMSLALGNMFRYAIKTNRELVTLREEIDHVLDYQAIQQIRFEHKYHLLIDVPETLLSNQVLKLILQPLVENALNHGLKHFQYGDEIRIHARSEDSNMILSVSDNGTGISEDDLRALHEALYKDIGFTNLGKREKHSIGLKNIHSRIELYYGKGYGLTVHSKEKAGTTVEIKIPVLARTEED